MLFSDSSQKAAQFIQLCNKIDMPLVFLQNITGYMVGRQYEHGGIVKHGSQMINAVSNSTVPHITVILGASYGAGNYGMCGRAYDTRFVFTWPTAKIAIMGPKQMAGVMSIVRRGGARAAGRAFDEEEDARLFAGGRGAGRAGVARRSTRRAASRTTASSTRATRARCSASRCRRCTATRSAAPTASACSGCDVKQAPIRRLLVANRGRSRGGSSGRVV